ncbi:MAG: glycerol-3-phosphate 1-O-acyltransferase PlsY [Phycisphaerales bacterium]|nr:glycerol-3-phosphate 1-O-acyltransferase PlsY [Planctomycetota bacterium]MCH8509794.1 glycerol-3-phosphate 1-O-acyltransferase PlsY [Phycisphaerales bacterium]
MFWPLAVIAAFLIGSIPFGYLLGKANGIDLRTVGSKNIGATNLGRMLGSRWFFVCFLLDMAKGFVPAFIAGHRAGLIGELAVPPGQAAWWLAVLVAAVLGHMFTPWLGFKGGKGVATGLGALLGIFPALALPGIGSLVVFLMVLALWRYVSAASIAAALALPLWTWYAHAQFRNLREQDLIARSGPGQREADAVTLVVPYMGWPFVAVAAVMGLLVVYKHRPNIERLFNRTEPRLGDRAHRTPDEAFPGVAPETPEKPPQSGGAQSTPTPPKD